MKSGTQWVKWAIDDMNTKVVAGAFHGDSSNRTNKSALVPSIGDEPVTLLQFIKWLTDTHHKVRMDLITHTLACSSSGEWSVKPKEEACLQTVSEADQRKTKNFNLTNIAGLVDVSKLRCLKDDAKIGMFLTLHYWEKPNRILGDFPCIRATGYFSFKAGNMYKLT